MSPSSLPFCLSIALCSEFAFAEGATNIQKKNLLLIPDDQTGREYA